MAVCKRCHRTIPDGREFCENCEINNKMQADESYLDSLLSSVMANSAPEPKVNSKKTAAKKVAPSEETSQEPVVSEVPDLPSPDEELMDEPIMDDPVVLDEPDIPSLDEAVMDEPIVDEPIMDDLVVLDELDVPSLDEAVMDEPIADESDVPVLDDVSGIDDDEMSILSEEDMAASENILAMDDSEDASEAPSLLESDDSDMDELISSLFSDEPEPAAEEAPMALEPDDISAIFDEASGGGDVPEFDVGELGIPGMEDILGSAADEPGGPEIAIPDVPMDKIDVPDVQNPSDASEFGTEDDLLSAFTELPTEDGLDTDIDGIMDSINSGEFEHELSSLVSGHEETSGEKGKGKKKGKKSKDGTKQSLFKRLFFNIKEERTPEEEAARIEKLKAEKEAKKKAAEEAKLHKNDTKEQKKARAEQEKAAKAEAAAKAKEEKAAAAKAKKEEKALIAKQKKEAKLAIEEYEDEGKINKAGASILVVIFAILTVVIIVGTNLYTYNVSIQNAQTDFDRQRYNDAYYDVYGLDIKDEDIVLYDRIMTVMYVNKQLNSYHNYMAIGYADKALDSLLKGLQRYDKYIQLASILDIVDDMNYVKAQILGELRKNFQMTEAEARQLIATEEIFDYSEYVYEATELYGTYDY